MKTWPRQAHSDSDGKCKGRKVKVICGFNRWSGEVGILGR